MVNGFTEREHKYINDDWVIAKKQKQSDFELRVGHVI